MYKNLVVKLITDDVVVLKLVHPGNNHWIVLPCLATTITNIKLTQRPQRRPENSKCKETLQYLKIKVITCFHSYIVLVFQKPLLIQIFSYQMFDQGYVVGFGFSFHYFYVPTAYHNLTDGNTP